MARFLSAVLKLAGDLGQSLHLLFEDFCGIVWDLKWFVLASAIVIYGIVLWAQKDMDNWQRQVEINHCERTGEVQRYPVVMPAVRGSIIVQGHRYEWRCDNGKTVWR